MQSKSVTRERKLYVKNLRPFDIDLSEVDITDLSLGGDAVSATAAEINTLALALADADFTVGAEAGNAINVAIQLLDANGNELEARASCMAYLSDDANGDSVAATAPSGNVVIGTDGLAIPLVAKKCFLLTSEADGDIDITINEAGAATWYLVLVMPNGSLRVSGAITFAA